MKLSIGFSPCPNDTFIFDALINKKIDTKGIDFDLHLADVEELNLLAMQNKLDITKLSYHALSQCLGNYNLLSTGSALGRNCGPLLISKKELTKSNLDNTLIAIPGEWTTAHFLLKFYAPNAEHKKIYLFSDIEQAILNDEVDAGVIIHENRFTYQERGFRLIQDLGEYWEQQTSYAIPLGGIVVKNSLSNDIQQTVNQLIKESLNYAWQQNKQQMPLPHFVCQHAQEMSADIMQKHINLYVNDYSLNLGKQGKQAVEFMMQNLSIKNTLNIVE